MDEQTTSRLDPRPADLWYSVRRCYVDSFFSTEAAKLPRNARVMDLGGKRRCKRGRFDIAERDVSVEYVNLDPRTEPDYLCDAAAVPVENDSYDAVICGELLEHVSHPVEVLREAYRMLRPGGALLLTAPFHCAIHGDPGDFARYTDTWLADALRRVGFVRIEIERQGNLFTVSADMLKGFAKENVWPRRAWTRKLFLSLVTWWTRKAFHLERIGWNRTNPAVRNYTTGFGVRARKP